MKLYVVRHGQTDWNVNDLLQGSTNVDLNKTGISQANELAKKIAKVHFDAIYCSPLKRTIDTASAININRNLPLNQDKRLIEREFGNYEGLDGKSIEFKKYWDYSNNYSDNNVEPMQSFFNRVETFLEEIISKYGNTNKNVLIVTHNGVNLAISSLLMGLPENIFTQNINPCDYKIFDNPCIQKINPTFSIIIPAYNAKSFIDSSLSSIFEQSYKNYEIIVVDDCSTDNTYDILKTYNNIRLFKTPQNLRQGGARNLGIENSCGEYIVFLDSDDKLYDKFVLEKLHNCIEENSKPDIIYTGMKFCGLRNFELLPTVENCQKEYRLAKCKWANVISICWKNEFLKKNYIRFPEKTRYEDVYFNFLGIEKSNSYAIGNFISCLYNNRASSTTTTYSFDQALDTIELIKQLSSLRDVINKENIPLLEERIRQQASRVSVRLDRAIDDLFLKLS